MNAAARDTRLPLQARAIAFWILDNPSEGIDPDIIAKANDLAVSYVRKLLGKLAEFGHLIAPQKYRAEKGRIAYTPYMLPPQDKITATVEEPSRTETPHGQNNQSGEEAVPVEIAAGESSTTEYVHVDTHAAGDKDSLLSLKAKDCLVLSERDLETDALKSVDTRVQDDAPLVDDFEDEPVTEVDVRPVYERDNGLGKATVAYLERIGPVTDSIADEIKDAVKDYGWYAVDQAIRGAADEVAKAQRGERTPIKTTTWNYAKGTLRKQKSEGDLPVEPIEPVFQPDVPEEPEPVPVAPVAIVIPPVDEQWRELGTLVKSQNVELYRRYLSQCRYGGYEDGILTILVMTERIQNACRLELNHGGRFEDWCESVWQDLKVVEFALEDVQYAHPAPG